MPNEWKSQCQILPTKNYCKSSKPGEADRVEFKESLSSSAAESIKEAICAFANDLPRREKPGFVFVGVKNDKTIVGLPCHGPIARAVG